MAHWRFRLLLAVAILLQSAWHRRVGSGFANAQFTQTFTWSVRNNAPAAQWQPDSASPLREVINFPQHVVVLEYNCAYMIEICRNADAWYATNAGRSFIGLPFAYDFNSGRKGRSAKRRRRVCPTGKNGWKSTTTCPHGNQSPPMRHDGPWFTTLLEGNTKVNGLENERNAQNKLQDTLPFDTLVTNFLRPHGFREARISSVRPLPVAPLCDAAKELALL